MAYPDRLDELRRQFHDLGFALYAMEPGKPVTFEVYTPDGGTFSFKAETAEAAMLKAFPATEAPETPAVEDDLFA